MEQNSRFPGLGRPVLCGQKTKICTKFVPKCSSKEKGLTVGFCKPLNLLARPAGFEPATYGFVVRHSIQLSYERALEEILLTQQFSMINKNSKDTGFRMFTLLNRAPFREIQPGYIF